MDIMQELASAGAVLLDKHFVYKSQKHGSGYINPDRLLPILPRLQGVGEGLASEDARPDVVMGPDFGGNYLAFQAAEAFSRRGQLVNWVATKKTDDDDFVVEPERGLEALLPGMSVWVTEDLLTTGGSVAKVCRLVESHDATVLGVSVVVNRGGVTAKDVGAPRLEALANVSFEAVEAKECTLCDYGFPIVEDIGHGATFKTNNPDYHGGYIKLLEQ
jgi:orotate phosphoribosyltransferase